MGSHPPGGTDDGDLEIAGQETPGPFDDLLRRVARAPAVTLDFAARDDAASRPFVGRFELVQPLGRGGFGVVYRARDTELGRHVAVKLLRPDRLAQPGAVEPAWLLDVFHREAQAAAKLNHPNIITIYDYGTHDGAPYLVLELLLGEPLSRRLERGPLPPEQAVAVVTQICRGLGHAHASGVIHCDLKPGNVFLRDDGQVKILDFGLAHVAEALGGAGRGSLDAGTPAYMAPEQWRGEPSDERTDIFACGMILFEALCGRLPFDRTEAHPAERYPSLGARMPGVPAELVAITERALAVRPDDRYRAHELADALLDVALERVDGGWLRRLVRRPAIALGLTAATAAVVVLASTRSGDPAAPARPRPSPAAPREIRVTANARENNVIGAAISPDGKRIAWSDEHRKLHVKVLETGETRTVATPPGAPRIESIAWTPDGARLVLGALDGDDVTAWSVSLPDGAAAPLASGCGMAALEKQDGRVACVAARGRSIDIVDGTGRRSRVASFSGEAPYVAALAWSPDAQRIAYVVLHWAPRESRVVLETVATSGGAPVAVVDDGRLMNGLGWTGLAWLPDGRLVYTLTDTDTFATSLWTRAVSRDGEAGEASLLGTLQGNPASLSVTGDGSRLAYVRLDRQFDVYVAALGRSGGLDPRRFTLHDGRDIPTDFARDGAVLFWSDRSGRPGSLFRQRLDEDEQTVVLPDIPFQSGARVTPDGKGLIWFRPLDRTRGRWELVAVGEPTGLPRVVAETRQGSMERTPTVRCAQVPIGPCVIAEDSGDTRVFVEIDPGRGRVRDIARIPVSSGTFNRWDLDRTGETIVVAEDRAPYLVSVASGTLTRLPDYSAACLPSAVAWAPDGALLLTCTCDTDTSDMLRCGIIHYQLDGRTDNLWESSSCVVHKVSISPDGRHMAFSMQTLDTDVWMIQLAK